MSKTLIILNPHAASGKAGEIWKKIEPVLWDKLGGLVVAVTQRPEEVAEHLEQAYASGLTRVISIGGDGTNHAVVNALAEVNARHTDKPPMVYGMLPVGTGRDWARGSGMPIHNIEDAAQWITTAQPHPVDIGLINFDEKREHFLNIASAGIGAEVAKRVNSVTKRRPWTFLGATVSAILNYTLPDTCIELDGERWYEGRMYALVVANGTTFGRGMIVAPEAKTNDGLFDVVLVRDAPRLEVLRALQRVYSGTHLTHPAIKFGRAKTVKVSGKNQPLGLELDGEPASAQHMTFEVRPGLLHLLS